LDGRCNPQDWGYEGEPNEIAEKVLEEWIQDKETRTGAVAYCISGKGLRHLHMVLEDSNMARFTAVKKLYPKAHMQVTKGTKEQAENYIQKKGKFAESDEKVIYVARHGQIKGVQGQRKDFEIIEQMLLERKTPREIMSVNFSYRRYEKMIKSAYYDQRKKDTPFLREIKVFWHVGESGSGKSYVAKEIADDRGEDFIYMYVDYSNGGLDHYNGEPILFMDEFRGQIPYTVLLNMLQGYKVQAHARYANVVPLWDEVHITSVLPPEEVYRKMVEENKNLDTLEQLKRRITDIIYH